jgi:uncharacterized protein
MSVAGHWLRQKLTRHSHRARARTRAWLMRHPRLRNFLRRTGSLDVDEFTLARGVAVGLFIGLTPTVGIQTALMLGASALLRANFAAAFVVSWLNNPLTFPAFYFGFHQLGQKLMQHLPIRFGSLRGLEEDIAKETTALILGSLAVAIPAAILGYFVFLYIWRRFDLHLPARAQEPPDEPSDEH